MTALPDAPKLVTVTSPNGVRFTVGADYAPQFQGLITDLEARGYPLDQATSGGYNKRYIAGTDTPSQHSHGAAIDINWGQNPRGQGPATIPSDMARDLAKKYNLTWGGDWSGSTRDPMHFEITANHPVAPAPSAAPAQPGGTPAAADFFTQHLAKLQDEQAKLRAQQLALGQQQNVTPKPLAFGMINPWTTALQQLQTIGSTDTSNVSAPIPQLTAGDALPVSKVLT